ncbi:MAG: T9SS type A sorting domain-containing protein [Ignavibacteria bacterium]|nr:T9SS type A sorting domain-containing protein [Ignavibacteria bacterium]
MKSTTPIDLSVLNGNPFIIRDSCESPLSVTRSKLNYYNENSFNQEFTRCASHSVDFTFANYPYANFTSNRQNIFAGEAINFTDATTNNPTSWTWTFPGGSPSSSNLRNPANIRYNTPGVYNVTLQVSNSFGSTSITKPNYITVTENSNCPVTWQSNIIATDAAGKKDSVKIGMSPNATFGIDTCLGEYLLPPAPPAGIFDFRMIFAPTYLLDASKIDMRQDILNNSIFWMNFQPSVSGPITFTWDPSMFPTTGTFYLREDILGTNINMKLQNSFSLNNAGIRHLRIDYEFRATYPIAVTGGWNLTSIPLQSFDMSVASLFEFDVTSAFGYNNGYSNVTTLSNGAGYWLNFPVAKNYEIVGIFNPVKDINVVNGWNIIGPFEEIIPVNEIVTFPPGLFASSFFEYKNGYFSEDTLKPGKGYWIKTNSAGKFMKDTNDSFLPLISGNQDVNADNRLRIEIRDNTGNTSSLYLTNSSQITSEYELPPVPPSGIFDIRFSSDKYVEALGNNHNIKINSPERPLFIKVYNLNGHRLRLKDNFDGSFLNTLLKENEEVVINSSIDNLLLTEESNLPLTYELAQNYPNPFNPATTIKYQIPKDGIVKLSIYNMLGQEVKMLVNGFQTGGYYTVNFNASDFSSGVYYYKIESGSFKEIKSMILIK